MDEQTKLIVCFVILIIVTMYIFNHISTIIKFVSGDINTIDDMTELEFEKYIKAQFKNRNSVLINIYNPNTTNLLLIEQKCKTVIKTIKCDEVINCDVINEVIDAQKYHNAHYCMVITNSYFSDKAKELATQNNVILWNRKKLIKEFNI